MLLLLPSRFSCVRLCTSILIFKNKYLFIFGCAGSSLLFGLSLVVVPGLLIVVACLIAEHGLLGMKTSVVVVQFS